MLWFFYGVSLIFGVGIGYENGGIDGACICGLIWAVVGSIFCAIEEVDRLW